MLNSGYVLLIAEVGLGIAVVFVEVIALVDAAIPAAFITAASSVFTLSVSVSVVSEAPGDTGLV